LFFLNLLKTLPLNEACLGKRQSGCARMHNRLR
jgi:hypothetical protein